MAVTLLVQTPTHGRVLVEQATATPAGGVLVALHGYGQNAEEFLADVQRIPGISSWHIVSVQALNRFYTRDSQRIIANWMTREDREAAIDDNIIYVDRAIDEALKVLSDLPQPHTSSPKLSPLVFLGFSQGTAMAYRAALRGRHRARGVIALGGDIPPELGGDAAASWPPILIGAGADDPWYTDKKLSTDLEFLTARGLAHDVVRFAGAHEWTEEFRGAVAVWLQRLWPA